MRDGPGHRPARALVAGLVLAVLAAAAGGCGRTYEIEGFRLGMDLGDVERRCSEAGFTVEAGLEVEGIAAYRVYDKDPSKAADARVLFKLGLAGGKLIGIRVIRAKPDEESITALEEKYGDPNEDSSGLYYTWELKDATYLAQKDGTTVEVAYNEYVGRY